MQGTMRDFPLTPTHLLERARLLFVTIDPRGCMRIVDRAKDLVKSGGEWISSLELENMLTAQEAVQEVTVIACLMPGGASARWESSC